MEKFKGVLKRRVSLMVSFNLLAAVCISLIGRYQTTTKGGSQNINDLIHGFQVGIFIGLQLIILFNITKYIRALRNGEKLKLLYIEETDERRKLIQDKIGGTGYNFILAAIATAAIIAGFLHQIVFLTLLGVLVFVALIKGFLKIYYRYHI